MLRPDRASPCAPSALQDTPIAVDSGREGCGQVAAMTLEPTST